MNKLLSEFNTPFFEDWKRQLNKELKGAPESDLTINDPIEELVYTCYQHQEITDQLPTYGLLNYTSNDWLNFGLIVVLDAENANKKALHLLNTGADALRFELNQSTIDFQKLTQGIEFQYTHVRFCIHTIEQFRSIQTSFSAEQQKFMSLEIDFVGNEVLKNYQSEILAPNSFKSFLVANGHALQQCGANTWQEVAYCLTSAHEYLVLLTENGFMLNQAANAISFNIGVGSNYFMEISKVRALRYLWNKILNTYDTAQSFEPCKIYGLTGFTNKSLKDPYTNLLRQTTEVMSLVSGGVTGVIVQSYTSKSEQFDNTLAERMALNIPLILKEESYFHAVQDPQNGSYTVKFLSHLIAEKSWSYFQRLDEMGGAFSSPVIQKLKSDVQSTAQKRIERLNDKHEVLIGVSIFPNPENVTNAWKEQESYLGLEALVLEKSYKVFAS